VLVYSVYEPPEAPPDPVQRGERLAFVKEGLSWAALLVPPFWLIYHRMWLELLVFVLLMVGLEWGLASNTSAQAVAGWLTTALSLLLALEGNDLRAAALTRRGFQFAGVGIGRTRVDAELAFYRSWLPQQEERQQRDSVVERRGGQPPLAAGGDGEEVIGLFPNET
jgi:hypothetical protein